MTPSPIILVQCNDCSEFVNPGDVIPIGESVIQCWACFEKTREIVSSWAEPPTECALCHASFTELAARTPGKPVSMFPHPIDGTIGFLCASCSKAYVLKRQDLYGNTRFGWENKLK